MENDKKSPPVRLESLAAELNIPLANLEIDTRDIFRDATGFRVCTAFTASRVLELHRAREAKAQALAARNNELSRAAVDRLHASLAAGVERDGDPGSKVQELSLQFAKIDVSPIAAIPAMLAKEPPPQYEGSTMTPRPSRLDWLLGKAEGAGTFGPEPKRGKVHTLREKGTGK